MEPSDKALYPFKNLSFQVCMAYRIDECHSMTHWYEDYCQRRVCHSRPVSSHTRNYSSQTKGINVTKEFTSIVYSSRPTRHSAKSLQASFVNIIQVVFTIWKVAAASGNKSVGACSGRIFVKIQNFSGKYNIQTKITESEKNLSLTPLLTPMDWQAWSTSQPAWSTSQQA